MNKKIVFFLVLSFLIVLPLAFAASQDCTPPADADWVITSNVVCDTENIELGGDLLLNSGSLTLVNTDLDCSPEPQATPTPETNPRYKIELNAPTTIQGSTISNCGTERADFTANDQVTMTGSTLENSVTLTLKADNNNIQDNTFKNSVPYGTGLLGRPSVLLKLEGSSNNIIEGNEFTGAGEGDSACCGNTKRLPGFFRLALVLKNSDADIQDNVFFNSMFGASISDSSGSVVDNNTFSGIMVTGLGANVQDNLAITNNRFEDIYGIGLAINQTSNSNIDSNTFVNTPLGCDTIPGTPVPYPALALSEATNNNLDSNDIQNSACAGVVVYNSNGNVFDDLTVDSSSESIYALGSLVDISKSDLNNDIRAEYSSAINLIDTDSTTLAAYDSSVIFVKWLLDVSVEDNLGTPLDEAVVEGYQQSGQLEFNETTASVIYDIEVIDYLVDSSGTTDYNTYTINASKEGYLENFTMTDIDMEDMLVTIVLEETINLPPVAEAGDFVFGTTNEGIVFNFSGSYDPDGTIVEYFVDWGDGTNDTTTNPYMAHSYGISGSYLVNLTVTDNGGLESSDYTIAFVSAPMQRVESSRRFLRNNKVFKR